MPTYGCFNPCGRYDSIKKDDDIYDYICFCCAFVASFYCWPKSYSICFSCSRSCTLHRVPSSLPRNWASNKKSLLSCSFFGILYNTINNKSLQTFFSFWKTYLCCAILSLVSSYYTFAHNIPVCHLLVSVVAMIIWEYLSTPWVEAVFLGAFCTRIPTAMALQ